MKNTTASRAVLLIALSGLVPLPANAVSVEDVRSAYAATLKCVVANGNAEGERRDAGDPNGAARYDANAKRSFDGAFKLGGVLGLSEQQINRDLDEAQANELPRMVKDRSYFIDAVATCKGLGLMD
jgi:hypothetical protein